MPGETRRSANTLSRLALGWSFNNLSTFYRTFRRTFGAVPGDLRGGRDVFPGEAEPTLRIASAAIG
jgi:AraC-like DNA-binding protein